LPDDLREPPRSRFAYAALVALVITAGLGLRSGAAPLSPFVVKYGGDALWALMVFFLLGVCFSTRPTWQLALFALCFSFAIEFSQLYHAPWIDTIRGYSLGALVLGSEFAWPDLVAYVAGIALGSAAEWALRLRSRAARGGEKL
jgi:hypothetical protein